MESFYSSTKLDISVNATFIALIPEKKNVMNISKFISISLVGSVYKIVAKVLSRRLKLVTGPLISENQCAFLKGRQIYDGILITNEILHSVELVILKLDFSKAYDCVRWDFLEMVLIKMGFGNKWRSWIRECTSTPRISMLVNGSTTREFIIRRGLRQGDPLPLYLFIMVTKALNLLILAAERCGAIEGISNMLPDYSFTHLQFADDTVLFLGTLEKSLINVKLRCFEACSGLSINFNKPCLVGVVGVEIETVNRLAMLCGCQVGSLLINYLGIPLGVDPKESKDMGSSS
ncbi:hypothetical protein HRI_005194400 [Hibiscus trionum]|uniref:Reverse transcriptase domain-containing protein n=1 Tax=Hibiscus trionum TaxID=183268 RepID=A0A9W7MVG5_HIBTR|nr:hypothetical protein HRI_005194400 [Hibiscus trionum]